MRKFIFSALICFLVIPVLVSARIGVAVGSGRIEVKKQLRPGQSYDLPVLSIINNGDEGSEYEVAIEYHEGVPQLRPARDWIKFTPQKFYLEPGQVKNVDVRLDLPIRAEIGEYFAYLEGRPLKKGIGSGGAAIGIAAAAKLYFTVVPANIFHAWYYKLSTLYARYHPYDTIVLGLLAFIYVVYFVKKNFKFQIARK